RRNPTPYVFTQCEYFERNTFFCGGNSLRALSARGNDHKIYETKVVAGWSGNAPACERGRARRLLYWQTGGSLAPESMIREFLKNRAENLLSAHFGLQNFAASIVNIFFGVYLYQIGIPLWEIFLIWGITFFTRCLLRPVVLPLYFRYGVRRMLIIGIICNAISFLALERVTEVGIWLGIFMLLVAITDIFYWTAFHLYFALLGENMRRGKQVAIRNCMEFLSSFLAPLVSAILIVNINFSAMFFVGAGIMFFSGIPLFFVPDVELPL